VRLSVGFVKVDTVFPKRMAFVARVCPPRSGQGATKTPAKHTKQHEAHKVAHTGSKVAKQQISTDTLTHVPVFSRKLPDSIATDWLRSPVYPVAFFVFLPLTAFAKLFIPGINRFRNM
jgi:hypothetical protein